MPPPSCWWGRPRPRTTGSRLPSCGYGRTRPSAARSPRSPPPSRTCAPSFLVLLAADLVDPSALPGALLAALEAAPEAEAAVVVDPGGRRQWLAAAYRTVAVRRALDSLVVLEGVAEHRFGDLVDLLRVVDVPRADAGDIDTPDDLARLRAGRRRG